MAGRGRRRAGRAGWAALALLASLSHASAATVTVQPGGLAAALAAAAPGDVLHLAPGEHRGPVLVDKPLTLEGESGAVVVGDGAASTITLKAPDSAVRGLTIRGSGTSLERMDSGVFVGKEADRAVVEDDRLERNLIGVFLWGPRDAIARRNTIVGRSDLYLNDRGNGVQLWNTPGSRVEDNDVSQGRDGVFVTTSSHNTFRGNRFREVRFAVHYMYTNFSEISGNVSVGNHVGYALMYSHHLTVRDNVSDRDRDHGIALNYTNDAVFQGNVVRGGEKCVFIYNANKNRFEGNRFEGCDVGIHFTAGSERNVITDNAFIGNRNQVKYVGTRFVDWSDKGRGNYWSDDPAFDLNGDGIADQPYRPNDLVDRIVWAYPTAKLLLNSPAVQVLRAAQARLPALYPGGVVDSAPLMRPPAVPAAARLEGGS
jgi:nitrous oxidase accessory protein